MSKLLPDIFIFSDYRYTHTRISLNEKNSISLSLCRTESLIASLLLCYRKPQFSLSLLLCLSWSLRWWIIITTNASTRWKCCFSLSGEFFCPRSFFSVSTSDYLASFLLVLLPHLSILALLEWSSFLSFSLSHPLCPAQRQASSCTCLAIARRRKTENQSFNLAWFLFLLRLDLFCLISI